MLSGYSLVVLHGVGLVASALHSRLYGLGLGVIHDA